MNSIDEVNAQWLREEDLGEGIWEGDLGEGSGRGDPSKVSPIM